jgi:hypothetical protein
MVTPVGSVDVLGRTFTCSAPAVCSSVVAETSPATYASNRDCGLSAKINSAASGGADTWLWVFCDTPLYKKVAGVYQPTANGLWQQNTAGLATGATRDQRSRTSMTVRIVGGQEKWDAFIPPSPSMPCSGYRAAWPRSVVVLDGESGTTVQDTGKLATTTALVLFQNFCVNSSTSYTFGNTGVALWTWSRVAANDPSQQFTTTDPSAHKGIRATTEVLNYDLFRNTGNNAGFQFGAVVENVQPYGRHLRVLRCHDKGSTGTTLTDGCQIAQVPITGNWATDWPKISNPTSWKYLSTTPNQWKAFTATGETQANDAKPLWTAPTTQQATGVVSVTRNESLNRYIMVGMVSGFSNKAVMRTARTMTGPWSPPLPFDLPDHCKKEGTNRGCYHVVLHPELDDSETLGLTYVDASGLTTSSGTKQLMRVGTFPKGSVPDAPAP